MTSNMMNRVTANPTQHLQFNQGTLKIIGVYTRVWPIFSLVFLEKLFEENFGKKNVDDLLYLIGETQSYNASLWTVQKVGIPREGNELKIFKETAGHTELVGVGVTDIIRFDFKNKLIVVTIKNNIFCKQFKEFFGIQKEAVDHYVRGLMGGLGKFVFNEEVIVAQNECPSMGKSKSIYKIFPCKGAVEKYGKEIERFIPNPSLKTDTLKKLDVKRLVV